MADEGKEILEKLLKQVADLETAQKNQNVSKEALDKQVKELVETQTKAKLEAMQAELNKNSAKMRKARFEMNDEAMPSHATLIEKAESGKQLDFQRWNDDVYIMSKVLRVHPTELKIWKEHGSKYTELRKAMDSATAGEGLEWIPTDFSADLIDRVRLARKVSGLFPEIQMPTDPYKLPALTADSTAFLVSEQLTDDPAPSARPFTASKPTTANLTMNAIKLGVRVNFSLELQEDSIIPVLEVIKNNMAIAMAAAWETAIINGDDSGSHQDADVVSATDARKAWKGLRKLGITNTALSSPLTLANLRSMRSSMGKYAVDPSKLVFIVSAKGFMKLLGIDEVITLEKYGPNATVLQGELGKIDGISIVVSEFVRDDLNANGLFDVTSSGKSEILLVYVPAFLLGVRRKVTMKSFEDVQLDQTALVSSWRGTFIPVYDTATQIVVAEGVNLIV